jgi:poly(3-hydroxybutyrate) depolymerase
MVALHGCAQGSEATGAQGNWEVPADAFGMMVVSPSLPDKGVVRGCWYFHRDDNRRDNKHNVHIIGMVRSVLADPLFGIDPAQVYVTGISSGGGQAYALGCLAPDLFAGVAPVAAPTLPVGMTLFSIVRVSTDEATGLAHCRQLAGAYGEHFQTQLFVQAHGAGDRLVNARYGPQNLAVFGSLYDAGRAGQCDSVERGGSERFLADETGARAVLLWMDGIGHGWPAGGGPGGKYVFTDSPRWPLYLTRFLFENNRRVAGGPPGPSGIGDDIYRSPSCLPAVVTP